MEFEVVLKYLKTLQYIWIDNKLDSLSDKYFIITLPGFCDALGGAVVECEPKFEMISEIL